jgi:predicted transcriptional regulator
MAVSSNGGGGIDFQASIGLQDSFSGPMAAATAEAEKAMGSFTKLSANVVVLNQALELMGKAWSAIEHVVSASVGKYAEAERVTTKLQFAIASQGEAVAEGVAHFQHLTKEIQKHSTTSAGTLMGMAAQAKAMGISTKMTDTLLQASVELSAVLDQDVNTSFQQLVGTLSGMARGIGRYIPAVKSMTEEELRAGKAIDYVAERMKGFSAVEANTMLGRTAQITNAWGSVKKAIGEAASATFHIPGLGEGTNPIAKSLLEIAEAIKGIIPQIKQARDHVIAFAAGLYKAFVEVDWTGLMGAFARAFLQAAAAVTLFAVASNMSLIISSLPTLSLGFALVTARLWMMTKAFVAAGWGMALAALKVTVMAAGFVAIAVALDLVVRNFDKLGKLIQTVLIYTVGGALIVLRELVAALGKIVPGTEDMVAGLDKAIERLAIGVEPIKEGLDFGVAGKTWDEAGKFITNLGKGSDDMAKKLADAEKNAGKFGAAANKAFKGAIPLSDEFKKKLDEILKRYKDNEQAIAEAGLTEGEVVVARMDAAQKDIDIFQAQLKQRNMLTKAIREQLRLAREAEGGRGNVDLDKIRVKFMDDAVKKADELQQALEKQNLTERELVVAERDRTMAALALLRTQALANKVYGPAMAKSLNDAAAAANDLADTKLGELPLTLRDAFNEVGAGMKNMKLGFLWTGMGQAAEAAGSYLGNAMMDAGEVVGDVIGWAIDNGAAFFKRALSGDYMNMVSDLLEFVGNIPDMLVAAASRLGSIIDKLISQFPAMVQKLIDSLPAITQKIADAIPKMVDGLVAAFPKIIDAMNKSFSKIMGAIVEALPKDFASYLADEQPSSKPAG